MSSSWPELTSSRVGPPSSGTAESTVARPARPSPPPCRPPPPPATPARRHTRCPGGPGPLHRGEKMWEKWRDGGGGTGEESGERPGKGARSRERWRKKLPPFDTKKKTAQLHSSSFYLLNLGVLTNCSYNSKQQ